MDKTKSKKANKLIKNREIQKKKVRPQAVSIGDKKLVCIRYINKVPHINIRAYNRDEHGRMFSTKRGIMLTLEEWNRLKNQIASIDASCS